MSATLKANQVIGDDFGLSILWDVGDSQQFSGSGWRGGLRQLVLSAGITWLDSDVAMYMAQESFGVGLPLWDKITSYSEMGVAADYPLVKDAKGVLADGTFTGPIQRFPRHPLTSPG